MRPGADLLGIVATQVDQVLVVGLLSPELMGLYVIAQSAAGALAFIPTAVVPITMPRSTNLAPGDTVALTGRAARATLCLMLLASLPLVFGGEFLLRLVAGHGFTDAAAILPSLSSRPSRAALPPVLSQAFLAAGFPGTVSMLQGCGVLTSIPLMYWLIPRFRTEGCGLRAYAFNSLPPAVRALELSTQTQIASPELIIRRAEFAGLLPACGRESLPDKAINILNFEIDSSPTVSGNSYPDSHRSRHDTSFFCPLYTFAAFRWPRSYCIPRYAHLILLIPLTKGQNATLSCTAFYSDGTSGSCVSPVYTDDQSQTVD